MVMTTGTTYGADFGHDVQIDGIISYVDGDDTITDHEKGAMVEALFAAFRDEVDALLPDDMSWQPGTSEFVHPVDSDIPDADEMRDLFTRAWATVEDRYENIEREVLGTLPATIDDLERELRAIGNPIRRARVAGLLVDAGMRQMAGQVRAEAVHEATRRASREDVADLLGTGVPAVAKLIREHNARQSAR